MRQKKKTGVEIVRRRNDIGTTAVVPLLGVLTGCAIFLSLHLLFGLGDTVNEIAAAAIGVAVCFLWGMLQKKGREALICPILAGVALLLSVAGTRQMTAGFAAVRSSACEIWTSATGWLFLGPQVGSLQEQPLFTVVCALLLTLLGCVLVRWRPRAAFVVLIACMLAAVPLQPDGRVVLFVLLMATVLLVTEHPGGEAGASIRVLAFVLAAAIVIGCTGLAAIVRGGTWFAELSRAAEDLWHDRCYENAAPQLPEGTFTELPVADANEIALRVTMEQPESLYLRGFVGDTFDGDHWEPISNEAAAESSALLYWLHKDGFYPQTQLALLADRTEESGVTVENLTACSAYLYAPIGMTQLQESGTLVPQNLLPSALYAEGLHGQRKYSFEMVADAAGQLEEITDMLEQGGGSEAYQSAEGSYRAFVQTHDLLVPEEGMNAMKIALNACASLYGGVEELTIEEAEACALLFMSKYLAEDSGLVLPLSETAQGTAYQTATATVLALRYFGIPARYAEGYLISSELAEKVEAGRSIDVPASCATAWAEVYRDGIGWIPLALTPGFQAISGQIADSMSALQGTGLTDGLGEALLPEGEELNEEIEEEEDSPEEEPAETAPQTKVPMVLWMILLLLLLIALVLWLRRRYIVRRRETLFAQTDDREAVGCLFSDTARLLEAQGLRRGCGSMRTLCAPLGERSPALAEQLREMADINDLALFSSHPVKVEQRKTAIRFREETLKLLYENTKWHQRLVHKWIRCLY